VNLNPKPTMHDVKNPTNHAHNVGVKKGLLELDEK
jgi:hypothetical protein